MRKYFAPVFIVSMILTWLVFQFLNLITAFKIYGETISHFQKIVLLGIIFSLSAALLVVLIQRITEIRRGDDEDLRNY
jgi:ethanolamine transporter EutH